MSHDHPHQHSHPHSHEHSHDHTHDEASPEHSSPYFSALLALISAILFGAATPISKLLLEDLNYFQCAGLLYLGAAIAVAPWGSRGSLRPWTLDRVNQKRLLGAITFGGILGPVTLLLGLTLAAAASVSLWLNLELVMTAILGHFFFKDHLGRRAWFGVILAFLAASLLSIDEGTAGLAAGVLVLFACFCWGLDNHWTALIDGITPSQSTLWKGLVAGSVNLTIGLILFPFQASLSQVLGTLLLGALAYGASIALYIKAAQGLGATRAQVIFSSAPFCGLLLAALLINETLTMYHALASGLLIAAIVILEREDHEHQHSHEALAHEHDHSHDDGHHDHDHEETGKPANKRHSHWHDHPPQTHAHPHWPDLHHRHDH